MNPLLSADGPLHAEVWRWLPMLPLLASFAYGLRSMQAVSHSDWLDKDDQRQVKMATLLRSGAFLQYTVALTLLWIEPNVTNVSGAIALVGMGLYLQIWSWTKRSTPLSRLLARVLVRRVRALPH